MGSDRLESEDGEGDGGRGVGGLSLVRVVARARCHTDLGSVAWKRLTCRDERAKTE